MNFRHIYWHHGENQTMGVDKYKFCPLCGELLVEKIMDHQQRCTCPGCGYVHFRNPSPTISLLIVDNNMVLLGKRTGDPGKGTWATPSGYIEFGEDLLTTGAREAREETNLEVDIIKILRITESFFPPDGHYLNIYLLAHITGGHLHAGDDMTELRWFPLEGPLPDLSFQEDIDMIENYKQSRGV